MLLGELIIKVKGTEHQIVLSATWFSPTVSVREGKKKRSEHSLVVNQLLLAASKAAGSVRKVT